MNPLRLISKKTGLAVLACAAATGAFAEHGYSQVQAQPPGPEYGRVLSSTPIQTQVSTPRQVCGVEQVVTPAQKSGGGAILGAIAGGVVGNSMGHGSGRAATTAIGLIGGAMLGDHIEGGGTQQVQNVERCTTQNVIEYRTTGYNVIYEYAGRQYNVQMPNDPGQWIKLQVTPVSQQVPVQAQPYAQAYPAYSGNTVVYAAPNGVYAPAPVYMASPVAVGVSFGFGGGYYGGRHPRRWY
jgi:uncharacterized protein YcfJ